MRSLLRCPLPALLCPRPLVARPRTSGLVFLLAVCATGNLNGQCPDGTPPPCGARSAHAVMPAGNSVAVLYFDNYSTDSSDAYLAEGLTEEIIARLGDVGRLTVKSRYAVRRYRGNDAAADPATLGRRLGVAYLVTGSVQRSGSRLRVRAELARASTGDRQWGQEYERSDDDVFTIMSDIAQNVVAGVAGSLLPAEQAALRARPTASHEAYDHLLKGDVMLARRTPVSVRQAITEYETATRLDPALVQGWAKMSVAYGVLVQRGWSSDGRPPDDSLSAHCVTAAARALALDSTSSDAWMAAGYAAMVRDPLAWSGAEDGFRRAVALNPRNAEAWHQLGDLLGSVGRNSEASAAYRAALTAEPDRPVTVLSLAVGAPARESIAACDSVLAEDSTSSNAYVIRALDRLQVGDTAGARADRASLERTVPLGAEFGTRAQAARLTLAIGDSADARRRAHAILNDLPASGLVHPRIAGMVAAVLYRVGDRDAAVALLQRAPRGVALWQARGGADWLRDPRFRRVFEGSRPPWGK
jgi:TolB-like protein/tetratricopeptide (TPR) repeat protein